jgi:hypothetical protein
MVSDTIGFAALFIVKNTQLAEFVDFGGCQTSV